MAFQWLHIYMVRFHYIPMPQRSCICTHFQVTGTVRMSGVCNGTYRTTWTVWSVDSNGDHLDVRTNETTPGIETSRTFDKDVMEPGLYKVALTTQFTEFEGQPFFLDYEYVKFELASLVPVITDQDGGVNPIRTVYIRAPVTIDSSQSSDPAGNLESLSESVLQRTWSCRTGNIPSEDVEDFFASGTEIAAATQDCTHFITDTGMSCMKNSVPKFYIVILYAGMQCYFTSTHVVRSPKHLQ